MTDRFKYYRSTLVSGDKSTLVYWIDRHDGESFDIHPSDIPEGAIIEDVSFDDSPKTYIWKSGKALIKGE